MQGCRQGVGRGAEEPPDFKLMLLCMKAVTTKGHPKCIVEKQERNNSFQVMSSVTYTKIKKCPNI